MTVSGRGAAVRCDGSFFSIVGPDVAHRDRARRQSARSANEPSSEVPADAGARAERGFPRLRHRG